MPSGASVGGITTTFSQSTGLAGLQGWMKLTGGRVDKKEEACASSKSQQLTGCKKRLALEELEHLLWQCVGLRQHGRAGLLEDLGAREIGGFLRKVRIDDPAAGS